MPTGASSCGFFMRKPATAQGPVPPWIAATIASLASMSSAVDGRGVASGLEADVAGRAQDALIQIANASATAPRMRLNLTPWAVFASMGDLAVRS